MSKYEQLIEEDSNGEIFFGNKNIAQKFDIYFANIGNTYAANFSDSCTFEDYMSSANAGEPFRIPRNDCRFAQKFVA